MKRLEDFIPKKKGKGTRKAVWTMVRLDDRPDIQEFIEKRIRELGCTKQAYFIGLLDLDMEMANGRSTKKGG